MRQHRYLPIVVQLVVLISCAGHVSKAQTLNPEISFTVSMSKPWTHLLEVELSIHVAPNPQVPNDTDLIMPVWTPGSYLIREFERNVQDFIASMPTNSQCGQMN